MASNVEAWVLLSLALVTFFIHIYVRWTHVGPANFQLDDYLMPLLQSNVIFNDHLGQIVFVLETVAAYLVSAKYQGLTNSYMTSEQRKTIDPTSKEWSNCVAGLAVLYSRLTYGLLVILKLIGEYRAVMIIELACKISLPDCLFCYHVNSSMRSGRFTPILGVSTPMIPITTRSILTHCAGVCQPTNSPVYIMVVVILNIITDVYLLLIPLPLLWTVNISLKRKIPLMTLFSGAAFVITASIIRVVTIMSSGADGASAGSIWACQETFVSIVVSNLPIIQPLIRKDSARLLFSSKPSGQTYPLSSQGLQTLTNRGGNDTKKGKTNTAAPSHMQGSDEHILTEHDSSKDITVVSETVVQSEPWGWDETGLGHSATPPKDWIHMSNR
ncbi:hypothetical protein N7520_005843 [Penicillium odoratum]|uniref:uncharacterized protein n=1 Tax=Penicillium odoratum TaxID=1167516 RepID=UPI00254823A4|nr:uncharacterized protein N7520_005843 [Penicillium odoratum]KAJ5758687.1 hypothetical protein N7520_005843 [Penicillium odoratum]